MMPKIVVWSMAPILSNPYNIVVYCLLNLVLIPKIPCVFLPNLAVFDIARKTNFSRNKSMKK